MFGDTSLSFWEFAVDETLPASTIQQAVLEFLQGREDAVVYGAQAVNAYVSKTRATEDVDIMSLRAAGLADEIRSFLNKRFHIAARVRKVREGIGFRVYQVRKPENRHLVDVRPVEELPPYQRIHKVQVLTPTELISSKVICMVSRRKTVKEGSDLRDLRALLLTFPELKREKGPVADSLHAASASQAALTAWKQLVAEEILPEDEDAGF
jgi:nucleotidyltransferase AbiEii toxin of type IV toxin-antitoxin system